MRVYRDIDCEDFEFWGGAADIIELVNSHPKRDRIFEFIENTFDDAVSETDLNDYVWFDLKDQIKEVLGIDLDEDEEDNDDEDNDL